MHRICAIAIGVASISIGLASSAAGAGTNKLTTVRVAGGLQRPTFVTAAPGDPDHLFVLEKNSGAVRVVDAVTGEFAEHNFLNLFPLISTISERGLIGLAFHPNYEQNGFCYVCYTDLAGSVVLARYTREAVGKALADQSTAMILLTEPKPFPHHNSGMLQFGPDGYLYMSIGDGGGGYDPFNYAQQLDQLKGKILRIDVDSGAPYAIPPSNPFVGVAGARPEIYAYGLRNPWRFSVDPQTGDIWIGDVGQEAREEIDFIPAGTSGQNFGWRCIEGNVCTNLPNCGCTPGSYVSPLYTWTHDAGGAAATGGFVYRGCAMPWLQGTYFFADYVRSQIFSFRFDGTNITEFTDRTAELAPTQPGVNIRKITSFGTDLRGEIYICDYEDGEVFRIVPETAVGPDCNANTVPDGCEIAAGVVPDADHDGIIDFCVPGLSVTQLYLGQTATFQFAGAIPGETTFFILGFNGLSQQSFCLAPTNCIELAMPFYLLAALPADTFGSAGFSAYIPLDVTVSFAMQAVVYRGAVGETSLLSNVLAPPPLTLPPGP